VPAGDSALIELQVRAVGTRATPLVGAWSRFGWQHPGPILFYLLAVPYRLFGTAPFGMQLGAALINGVAIATAVLLVARRGRMEMWLMTAALAVLQLGLGGNLLRDEWNASVVVLPFALLLVAAAEARDDSRIALAVVPLAATFVAQTHVAYVALSLPAVALWIYAVYARRSDRSARRAAGWATGIAALCWLPVAIDAVAHSGGNVRKIVSYSFQSHSGTVGFGAALKLVGTATSLSPRAINGLKPTIFYVLDPKLTALIPGVTLVALVAVLLWRRADAPVRRLAGLLLATWLVGLVAAARIAGSLFPHLVWWLLPLTALSWWCIAVTATRLVATLRARAANDDAERNGVPKLWFCAVIAVSIALAITLCVRVAHSDTTLADRKPAILRATAAIAAASRRAHVPPVVDRTSSYLANGSVQAGVLAHLAHDGVTARVPVSESPGGIGDTTGNPAIFGSHRSTSAAPTFLLANRASLLQPPGRMLADIDPLDPAAQTRWRHDYDTVAAALTRAGHPELAAWLPTSYSFIARQGAPGAFDHATAAAFDDLTALNGRGDAVVVWALPRAG
jgi:hypothetical protein